MTAVEYLRQIIAAWTAGDLDEVDRLIVEAGTWLEEGDPDVTAEEPAATGGEGEPAPPEHKPTLIVGDADRALVALYNAAKRLIAQGVSVSTMNELEAAVGAAERFIGR